ncbi:MAG TPA: SUMF1/EgtB/PvdO family nonheme iron enzyme [Candidatus Limnocylindrales bacterium]|nr:SUMF1/EgtB/PvdO family nonheme iron enzyme [Candidatus Limnocylindrales bacterium]
MKRVYRLLGWGLFTGFLLFGADWSKISSADITIKKKSQESLRSSESQRAPTWSKSRRISPQSVTTKKSKSVFKEGQILYVKTEAANLRASPVENPGNIIDRLVRDTKVTFLRGEGNWSLVQLEDGRIGWIASSLLIPKKIKQEEIQTTEKSRPQKKAEEVSKPPSFSPRGVFPAPSPFKEKSEEVPPAPPPKQVLIPPQPKVEFPVQTETKPSGQPDVESPIQIETKSSDQPDMKLSRKVRTPEDMVFIPAGEATLGSSEGEINKIAQRQGVDPSELADEKPQRQVFLKGFFMDKYEVTNAQYKKFVDATGHKPPRHWEGNVYPSHKADHPVVYVSWEDAAAYCKWAGKRLPTAEEWEKAARGSEGFIYPWGNEYGGEKVNLVNAGRGDTSPVDEYQGDVSPYGVYDMGGNVSEWTRSWYDSDQNSYTLKGGSWYTELYTARGAHRSPGLPEYELNIVGFRCAKDP